jgi:hypothetical protein
VKPNVLKMRYFFEKERIWTLIYFNNKIDKHLKYINFIFYTAILKIKASLQLQYLY